MYNAIKKKSIMLILVPQLTNCQTDKIIHTVVFILNDYINACLQDDINFTASYFTAVEAHLESLQICSKNK